MKGKIRKIPDRIYGKEDFYSIEYKNGVEIMFIPLKDMDEFMDDINKNWDEYKKRRK